MPDLIKIKYNQTDKNKKIRLGIWEIHEWAYNARTVAAVTGEQTDYMKQRGIDDGYCQKMIVEYLHKFNTGSQKDFETLLLDKLPDVLDIGQKKNKIKNNLQVLRKQGIISLKGKLWKMSKPD